MLDKTAKSGRGNGFFFALFFILLISFSSAGIISDEYYFINKINGTYNTNITYINQTNISYYSNGTGNLTGYNTTDELATIFVPYSGATGTVDLNIQAIKASYLLTSSGGDSIYVDNRELADSAGDRSINWDLHYLYKDAFTPVFDWYNLKFPTFTDNGFLKVSGGDGTIVVDTNDYLISYTETDPIFTPENATLARTGNCPAGFIAQNITTGGVQCVIQSVAISAGNISKLIISATALSGVNAGFNRTYDLINVKTVSVDGIEWNQGNDYIYNDTTIILLHRIWNDQKISFLRQ